MARETELYKDKIEVSLDGRQIFYLFFGGAVIVGLVFVLGVMVGRRVEARGHVERAQTQAAVDPLAALDRLESGSGLSFQGALRGDEQATSDVEKTIGEIAKARPDAKKPDTAAKKPDSDVKKPDSDVKKPDSDVKNPDTAAKKPDSDVKKPDTAAKKPDSDVKKPDTAAKKPDSDVKKPDTAAKKPDTAAKKPDNDVKKPDSDVKKPDTAAKQPDSDAKKPDKARFTLQLSSFQDKAEAQAFLDSVKSTGYQAYLTEGAVDGKQFYRVRLGTYRSLEAANDAKSDFEKNAKKSAFVTKL